MQRVKNFEALDNFGEAGRNTRPNSIVQVGEIRLIMPVRRRDRNTIEEEEPSNNNRMTKRRKPSEDNPIKSKLDKLRTLLDCEPPVESLLKSTEKCIQTYLSSYFN